MGGGGDVLWCGNLRKRGHFENLGVVGKIILEGIFKKSDGRA